MMSMADEYYDNVRDAMDETIFAIAFEAGRWWATEHGKRPFTDTAGAYLKGAAIAREVAREQDDNTDWYDLIDKGLDRVVSILERDCPRI